MTYRLSHALKAGSGEEAFAVHITYSVANAHKPQSSRLRSLLRAGGVTSPRLQEHLLFDRPQCGFSLRVMHISVNNRFFNPFRPKNAC